MSRVFHARFGLTLVCLAALTSLVGSHQGLAKTLSSNTANVRAVSLLLSKQKAAEESPGARTCNGAGGYGELALWMTESNETATALLAKSECRGFWQSPRGQLALVAAARWHGGTDLAAAFADYAPPEAIGPIIAALIDVYISGNDAKVLDAVVEIVNGTGRVQTALLPSAVDRLVWAYSVAGGKAYDVGDWQDTVLWYGRILGLRPDDPAALARRGWGLLMQGVEAEAVRDFERATVMHPESSAGWIYLGAYHFSKREYSDAELALARAVTLAPEEIWQRSLLADTWLHEGKCQQAAEEVSDTRFSRDALALRVRVDALWCLGMYVEAKAAYSQLIEIAPQFAERYRARMDDAQNLVH